MTRHALITGGYGFLGRAVARKFHQQGYRVTGLGRGHWPAEEAREQGFDRWLDAGVGLASLITFDDKFDVIVHCGGGSSVGYSISNPLQDFGKTVESTANLLDFVRLKSPSTLVIYPSSAGVYGHKDDRPIREDDPLLPISPYGYHKLMAEQLLTSYSRSYGVRVAIIRFFSIYGPGLSKQLLWDAGLKLATSTSAEAVFWGTGEETRDWISAADAAELVWAVSQRAEPSFLLLNGASGVRTTVRDTLQLLRDATRAKAQIAFNGAVREGDPRFFHADVSRARALGWEPRISLQNGIMEYVEWLDRHRRYVSG